MSLKGTRDARRDRIEEALAPAFESLAPEPEPEEPEETITEPTDTVQEEEPEGEPCDFQAHRSGSELFSAPLGLEMGGRSFHYSYSQCNHAQSRAPRAGKGTAGE